MTNKEYYSKKSAIVSKRDSILKSNDFNKLKKAESLKLFIDMLNFLESIVSSEYNRGFQEAEKYYFEWKSYRDQGGNFIYSYKKN